MTGKQALIVAIGLTLVWLNLRAGGFRFPSSGTSAFPSAANPGASAPQGGRAPGTLGPNDPGQPAGRYGPMGPG